jgi:hypothetical protein
VYTASTYKRLFSCYSAQKEGHWQHILLKRFLWMPAWTISWSDPTMFIPNDPSTHELHSTSTSSTRAHASFPMSFFMPAYCGYGNWVVMYSEKSRRVWFLVCPAVPLWLRSGLQRANCNLESLVRTQNILIVDLSQRSSPYRFTKVNM